MIETATFVCSICNEPSLDICLYCTKDTCRNHRCERCKRCSDCCECEVPLVEPHRDAVVVVAEPVVEATAEIVNEPATPAPLEPVEPPDPLIHKDVD